MARLARPCGLVLVALGLVVVVAQLAGRPSPDAAWNLYAAEQVLAGGRLGVDFLENSPPMILGLKLPAVALADVLGVRGWAAWVVLVAGLAALSVALTWSLLAGQISRRTRVVAAVAIWVALILLPSVDYGQRDHIMVILVVPYVALVAARISSKPVPTWLAILGGLLAGVGIGIKPHFAALPVTLALLLASRRSVRAAVTPEHGTIVAVGLAYLTAVWRFTPEYFQYAATYAPLYQRFQTEFFLVHGRVPSLPPWLVAALVLPAVPGYVAIGATLAARRYQTLETRLLGDVIAVATAALLVVAIVQGKGWRYHFLPADILAVLLLTLLVASGLPRAARPVARVYFCVAAGVLTATVLSVFPTEAVRALHPRDERLDADSDLAALLPVVQAVGPRGHVAVFSTNIASSFPLLLEGGAKAAFRHPNLWPLVAFYSDQIRGESLVRTRAWDQRPPLEQQFSAGLVEDLERTSPAVLLVARVDTMARGWGGAQRFDYLGYFAATPGFAEKVMPEYRAAGTLGIYHVYWRGPGQPPALVGQPQTARRSRMSLPDWTSALTIGGFLVGLLFGLMRLLLESRPSPGSGEPAPG